VCVCVCVRARARNRYPYTILKMAKIVSREKYQSGNKWCHFLVALNVSEGCIYCRLCNALVQVTHKLSERDGAVRGNHVTVSYYYGKKMPFSFYKHLTNLRLCLQLSE
jgi:hypothetical protein